LLDINMPDVNGYEVCSRIKADSRTAFIPVIFYTAQASSMAKTHAEMVGAAAFFTYPVALDQVKTAIQVAVAKTAKAPPISWSCRLVESTWVLPGSLVAEFFPV
jgi:CheY-like chemotaxis protein